MGIPCVFAVLRGFVVSGDIANLDTRLLTLTPAIVIPFVAKYLIFQLFANGTTVAQSRIQEGTYMFQNALHDAVVLLAILVIVAMCAVAALRMIGKTKRERRPLQTFR